MYHTATKLGFYGKLAGTWVRPADLPEITRDLALGLTTQQQEFEKFLVTWVFTWNKQEFFTTD